MKLRQRFILPLMAGVAVLGAACDGPQPAPDQPGGVPAPPDQAPTQPEDPAAPGQPGGTP